MQASPFAGAGLGPFEDALPQPAGPLDPYRLGSGSSRDVRSIHRRSLDDAGIPHMATSAGSGAALPAAASLGSQGRSASVSNPFDVTELLARISLLPPAPARPPTLASAGSGGGPRCLSTDGGNQMQWVQPSGPRRMGQGVEDVEQGVVLAQPTPTGGALLRITLLAAGFLVGPSGSSVREICRATGADIKSWTADPDEECTRSCRVFRVEGPRQGVARAVGIMCDAVGRYKELCEGAYAGKSVARIQHVGGVDFSYQPPPRNIVPYAASLKGQGGMRRQGSGRQGSSGAPNAKPPAAPRKTSMGRSGSLGAPSASSLPAPSASLSRSVSVPQPPAAGDAAMPPAGSPPAVSQRAGGGHLRSNHSARSAAGSRPGSKQGEHDNGSPGGVQPEGGVGAASAPQLHRSPSAEAPSGPVQHNGQPMAPARTLKLEKDDVMRSVFGAADRPTAPAHLPAPAVDVTALLQQLMLQEAQQQATASALLGQQAVRGGYELTEPGVLLPASLSPLAPAPQPLPPISAGLTSIEAQLAAQGLAGNAGMLAAVAAAWQSSPAHPAVSSVDELLQLAAAGLLGPLAGPVGGGPGPARQPSASRPPLAAEHAGVPLAPHPSLDGAAEAALATSAASSRPAMATSRGGSPPGQDHHLPLSAFQTTGFTPFASVGSPPSGTGPASPPSGRSSESGSRGGASALYEQQEPATPRQHISSAGAVLTPGSGQAAAALHQEHATPDVGTQASRGTAPSAFAGQSLASLVAAPQPMALGADIAGTLASAFALLPGGGELAGEPQGPAGEEGDRLSPFSSAPFLPLSGAALARAASTPGPQGSCSSIDRLHSMLAFARANSYTAPSEPGATDAVPDSHDSGSLEPQFAGPAPSHGSLFASAFSPRPRGLRQAPSLPAPPLAPPLAAAGLGLRSASSGGALGGSTNIYSEVDRMLDAMF